MGLKNGEYREAQRLKNGEIHIGERGVHTEGSLNLWSINKNLAKKEMIQEIKGYHPSTRPWYRSAVDRGVPTWSDVYFYASNHHAAISENQPLRDTKGNFMGVLTTSISLNYISTFLSRIDVSPNSKIIITEPSGLLIAASCNQPLINSAGERINGMESKDRATNTAVKEFMEKKAGAYRIHPDNQWIRIKSLPFKGPFDLKWRIFIISPEVDFTGGLNILAYRNYIILIALLFSGLVAAFLISRKIAGPIKQLSDYITTVSYDSIQKWDMEIPSAVKTASVEIESLSANFTFMMRRLKSSFTELKKSKEKYKDLLENINSIVMTITPDGTITYCNPFGLLFYGYTENELVGSKAEDTILHTGNPQHKNIMEKIFTQDKEYWNGENVNITKEGREVWILWSNKLVMNEDGTVKELFSIGEDITARKEAQTNLEKSLKDKTILLSEVHHRVKNNLQIIISLINLQLNDVNDEAIIKHLQIIKTRIHSMSLVHELLYSSTSFSAINLTDYIRKLADDILQTFNTENNPIDLKIVSDNVVLGIDQAVTLGLIVNELISNAVKYAFPDRSDGIITIELANLPQSKIRVIVRDNGIGFTISDRAKSGLGTLLITALTDQLGASLERKEHGGTVIQLTFQKR